MEIKKKISLEYPIEIKQDDGSIKKYGEVEIGRLKNKHLKLFPKDFFKNGGKITPDQFSPIFSALTGLSSEVADEVDIDDMVKIMEGLESFLEAAQKKETGKE